MITLDNESWIIPTVNPRRRSLSDVFLAAYFAVVFRDVMWF
jgi:hypothetical protein